MSDTPVTVDATTRNATLLASLGIDSESFNRFVSWALTEHLVASLVADPSVRELTSGGKLKPFRDLVTARTGRVWSPHDVERLYERVKQDAASHYRKPIEYGEYLKLLWQLDRVCVKCGRRPPEVVLHIDHIVPASKGGSSKRANLQYLCARDNLRKSNSREVEDAWLDFQ
jgi:hypothetical protein